MDIYNYAFASCIGTLRAFKGNMRDTGLFFMITGMITSYMDFLTTETLTLLVPLLLIIWIDIRNKGHADVKKILKSVLFWSIGYIGMWLMKWGLAAVILRENVMPYITGHVRERLGGDIGIAPWRYYVGAVTRNIRHLFHGNTDRPELPEEYLSFLAQYTQDMFISEKYQ